MLTSEHTHELGSIPVRTIQHPELRFRAIDGAGVLVSDADDESLLAAGWGDRAASTGELTNGRHQVRGCLRDRKENEEI